MVLCVCDGFCFHFHASHDVRDIFCSFKIHSQVVQFKIYFKFVIHLCYLLPNIRCFTQKPALNFMVCFFNTIRLLYYSQRKSFQFLYTVFDLIRRRPKLWWYAYRSPLGVNHRPPDLVWRQIQPPNHRVRLAASFMFSSWVM